jgi:FlaA1/EpsC-like NDP-sugar epimerase
MGILQELRADNLKHDLTGKNVLVVGGTEGIGAASI